MRSEEEIRKELEERINILNDVWQHSSNYGLGHAEGWVEALKWVLEEEEE